MSVRTYQEIVIKKKKKQKNNNMNSVIYGEKLYVCVMIRIYDLLF